MYRKETPEMQKKLNMTRAKEWSSWKKVQGCENHSERRGKGIHGHGSQANSIGMA